MRTFVAFFTTLLLLTPVLADRYPSELREAGKDVGLTSLTIEPLSGKELEKGGQATIKFTVHNGANSASGPYQVTISAGSFNKKVQGSSLFSGRSKTHTVPFEIDTGKETVFARLKLLRPPSTLDDASHNNQVSVKLDLADSSAAVSSDGIDLVIDSLSHRKLEFKEAVMLDVYVGNHGTKTARGSIKVEVSVEGGYERTLSVSGGLRPNESKKVHLEIPANYARKRAKVTVTVDPQGRIKEADERNNSKKRTLSF